MTAQKVLGIIQILIAALLVVGVLTFAGPCVHEDGSAAMCSTASQGIIGGGVLLLIGAILQLVIKSRVSRIAFAVVCIVAGVFVILAPGTIFPLCMMAEMHCQAVMKPFAMLCGGAAAIVAVIAAIVAART